MSRDPYRWIAVDDEGGVHARIGMCDHRTAIAVVKVIFPELDGRFKIKDLGELTRAQRQAALVAPQITPRMCARLGVPVTPQANPPVQVLAGQLKRRWLGGAA